MRSPWRVKGNSALSTRFWFRPFADRHSDRQDYASHHNRHGRRICHHFGRPFFSFKCPLLARFWLSISACLSLSVRLSAVGLFISSLCAHTAASDFRLLYLYQPRHSPFGFATPIENMPQWLQYFTYINPPRYFLQIARGIFLKAMPADVVFHLTWPMALIALFTLESPPHSSSEDACSSVACQLPPSDLMS